MEEKNTKGTATTTKTAKEMDEKMINDMLDILAEKGETAITTLIKALRKKGWKGLKTSGSIDAGTEDYLHNLGFDIKQYLNADKTVRKTTVNI